MTNIKNNEKFMAPPCLGEALRRGTLANIRKSFFDSYYPMLKMKQHDKT
jgi:hypothetical protein